MKLSYETLGFQWEKSFCLFQEKIPSRLVCGRGRCALQERTLHAVINLGGSCHGMLLSGQDSHFECCICDHRWMVKEQKLGRKCQTQDGNLVPVVSGLNFFLLA